jgi:glycosyltransferase involved in cell wall biosynthesis
MAPLVSVIIPAYNAEATIAETLESAIAQSESDTEIIIVNDGSTDGTAEIIRQYAERDQRIVSIAQPRAGVASARNAAIAVARGEYIAPLDADDLWHPRKLERQLGVFARASTDVALVYNWSRRIRPDGTDTGVAPYPSFEGWVLHRHLDDNFISNGSTPLIRTAVLRPLGYEERLRAAGNEGCEDYLMQLKIARRFRFACAPAYLTGYRMTRNGMSRDTARMIRSHLQVFDLLTDPADAGINWVIRRRVAALQVEYARNRLRRLRLIAGSIALGRALKTDAGAGVQHGMAQFRDAVGRSPTVKSEGSKRHFHELSEDEPGRPWRQHRGSAVLARLEALDQAYGL